MGPLEFVEAAGVKLYPYQRVALIDTLHAFTRSNLAEHIATGERALVRDVGKGWLLVQFNNLDHPYGAYGWTLMRRKDFRRFKAQRRNYNRFKATQPRLQRYK